MSAQGLLRSVEAMDNIPENTPHNASTPHNSKAPLNTRNGTSGEAPAAARPGVKWQLAAGLGAIALLRPLARMTGIDQAVPAGPWMLMLLISMVWIGVVGLGRVARPVLTLTLAGIAYGLFIIPLSAVVSTVLTGDVQGPMVLPIAIAPILIMNGLWGFLAGLLAAAVQRLRGRLR